MVEAKEPMQTAMTRAVRRNGKRNAELKMGSESFALGRPVPFRQAATFERGRYFPSSCLHSARVSASQ
jgi:hypothetical protein